MTRQHGFTLLEMLVAVAILAFVGALAYGGLSQVMRSQELVEDNIQRSRQFQFAIRRLSMDLLQAQPRPIRDEFGDVLVGALRSGGNSGVGGMEITSGGWRNPMGAPRSNLQRISYGMEEDRLVRVTWPVLDRTQGVEPLRQELLTGVTEMIVRFMDPAGQWQNEWPPTGFADPTAAVRLMPLAVEFTLVTEQEGAVTRLIEVAQ